MEVPYDILTDFQGIAENVNEIGQHFISFNDIFPGSKCTCITVSPAILRSNIVFSVDLATVAMKSSLGVPLAK